MLRILISAVCLSLSGSLCAQAPFSFMEDGNGRPLFIQSNYISEGSPYFNDDYIMAQVTALNGAICHNVQVKINLVDHIVQYLGHGGKEMITETPVKEIRFPQYVFEDGHVGELVLVSYAGAMNSANAIIYQVVDSGKLTLLKNTFITYRDDKKYGSASTTRIFDRKETYSVLLPDGRVKHIEKGRDNILSLFPDKQKQVDNFIEQDKLKCNSGKDYDLIFRFYNAL